MKRKVSVVCAFLCTFLIGSAVFADPIYNTTTSMNFRSGPSSSASLISSVPKGSTITYISSQNGWDYISFNGVSGWIHGGNIQAGPPQTAAQTVNPQTTAVPQAAAPAATSTTPAATSPSATVLYNMNFRSAPGLNAQIMTTVPKGTQVSVVGSQNGWDQIVYNGTTGWIAGGHMSVTTAAGGPSTTANTTTAPAASTAAASATTTVTGNMNFRSAPGLNSQIINTVPKGSKVTVLGSQNGWDQIIFNGTTGWIAGGYTSNAAAVSTNTQAPAASTYTYNAYPTGINNIVGTTMNFRAEGGLNSTIIGLIPTGSYVNYLLSSNGWDKVVYQGITGWIKSGNLR